MFSGFQINVDILQSDKKNNCSHKLHPKADSFAGVCLQKFQKTREHNEGRNITNRAPAETEDFYFQLWLGGSKASW